MLLVVVVVVGAAAAAAAAPLPHGAKPSVKVSQNPALHA